MSLKTQPGAGVPIARDNPLVTVWQTAPPDREELLRRIAALGQRIATYVGFMGQAPHYLPETENPAAIEVLVSYVARLLNLSPDMSYFPEAIREFRAQCDQAVARDRATREHVRKLEQEYDAAAQEESSSLPEGDLDTGKLMRDLEEFLRRQQGSGEGGQGESA